MKSCASCSRIFGQDVDQEKSAILFPVEHVQLYDLRRTVRDFSPLFAIQGKIEACRYEYMCNS